MSVPSNPSSPALPSLPPGTVSAPVISRDEIVLEYLERLPYVPYPPDLIPSTSRIVNQPCLPWIHRAAARAPRANAVRSRAV